MRFWDTSAIVPLLVDQPRSHAIEATLAADDSLVVWWAAPVECASAIARLEREGLLRRAAADLLDLPPVHLAPGAIAPSGLVAEGRAD